MASPRDLAGLCDLISTTNYLYLLTIAGLKQLTDTLADQ